MFGLLDALSLTGLTVQGYWWIKKKDDMNSAILVSFRLLFPVHYISPPAAVHMRV